METDILNFFTHGSEYGQAEVVESPRSKPCKSCAFSNSPETVRPPDVSLAQITEHAVSYDYDVFYCHCSEEGKYKICAGWAAMFPEKFTRTGEKTQLNQGLGLETSDI